MTDPARIAASLSEAQVKRIRRAMANSYDGGIWEGNRLNKSPFVTVRLSDMKALLRLGLSVAQHIKEHGK